MLHTTLALVMALSSCPVASPSPYDRLKAKSQYVRAKAAVALGVIGDEAAVAALSNLAKDDDLLNGITISRGIVQCNIVDVLHNFFTRSTVIPCSKL